MAQLVRNIYVELFQQLRKLPNMFAKPAEPFPVHGKIMLIVWAIIAPLSILFGKFGRNFMPRKAALGLHILCNLGMITCGGFAVYLAVSSCTQHFASLHQKLGLTIASLSIVQGILGLVLAISRGSIGWVRRVHGLLGISLWLAAMNNAFLGSELLGWHISAYLGAYMFLMISVFVGLSCCSFSWFEKAEKSKKRSTVKIKKKESIPARGSPAEYIDKKRVSHRKLKE